MTKDEVLKLALEALEHIQRCIGFGTATIHHGSATWCEIDDSVTAIREALEQPEQSWIERERAVGYREGHQAAIRQMAKGIHFDSPPLNRPEQEPVAWLITDKNINSIQIESIQRLIDRAKHAHMTDIKLRINGEDEWYQADWLKHLTRATPPQPEQEPVAWLWRHETANYGSPSVQLHFHGDCYFDGWEVTPLYTTPPQRTWVGLTDEEMSIVALREKTSDHDVDCLCADCTLLDEMEDAQKCYCGNIYRLGVVHRESSFCDEHPRKPLKIEELPAMRDGDHAFFAGVRFAEAAHGIKG